MHLAVCVCVGKGGVREFLKCPAKSILSRMSMHMSVCFAAGDFDEISWRSIILKSEMRNWVIVLVYRKTCNVRKMFYEKYFTCRLSLTTFKRDNYLSKCCINLSLCF